MAQITQAEVYEIAQDLGLVVQEQTSFLKLAVDKKAIYVSRTKRAITRVDVSGFSVDHPAIRPPLKHNGRVTGQVLVSHPESREAIVAALELLVDRKVKGNKLTPSTQPAAPKAPVVRETQDQKAERIAEIKASALRLQMHLGR